MALADMLNAAMLGADLLEVRLDRFERDVNLADIVGAKRKPVMFSCKRPKDGGQWQGTEDERLTLLRAAVIAKADYVEVELDAADQVRPFPGCQRVISYTQLDGPPRDLDSIYKKILDKNPDAVKLTFQTNTPEEAWPLILLLNKPQVPTVVEGRGACGRMLTLLAKKIGAPWASAAIERGTEAFIGQPTIDDLNELYRYRDIGKKTRFVGIIGDSPRARTATDLFNTAFVFLGMHHRVLPMQMGNRGLFKKIADSVRLQSVFLDDWSYEGLHEIARLDPGAAYPVQAADALFPGEGEWSAANTLGTAVAAAVEAAMVEKGESLKGRVVALAGCGPLTRMVAGPLRTAGAALLWASKNRELVLSTSQTFGGRQAIWEAIYTTGHEVLVLGCDGGAPANPTDTDIGLHPGYLKPGMTVVDLLANEQSNQFLEAAADRGCRVISPTAILIEQIRAHVRRLGSEVPAQVLTDRLSNQEWGSA